MLVILVLFIVQLASARGNDTACGKDEFSCFDGSCVHKDNWCDTEIHCVDGSDENYCSHRSMFRPNPNGCNETVFFKCDYGPCIPLKGRCDGHYACIDHSDEDGCVYTTKESTKKSSVMTPEADTSTRLPVTTHLISELTSVSSATRSDSVLSYTTDNSLINLEKGFAELDVSHLQYAKLNAQHWLLSVRSHNDGWNEESVRAFTALHLSEEGLHLSTFDKSLMTKELHLKILAALFRNESNPVSLDDLSLYMNALAASCASTRNFYGRDLVHVLRQQADFLQRSSNSSNPLIYLTLCLNGATKKADLISIKEIVHNELNEGRLGVLALASLAATCISKTSKFESSSIGKLVASHLVSVLMKQGLPDNTYELALVTQALNEAHVNQDLWNRSEALRLILKEQDSAGSFGNILSTYFAIPVLSGKTLLSAKNCSDEIPNVLDDLDEGDKIKFTLYFGNPVTSSISLFVPIQKSSFFDVMRKAATLNPSYEFRYTLRGGKPVVYSIGGVANDPEHGMYWHLYITDRHNSSLKEFFRKYTDDLRLFTPVAGEEVVYWWKSIY